MVIHSLPGRLRLAVSGLKSNKQFEIQLVKAIYAIPGIYHVSASIYTGRLLIQYNPEQVNVRGIISTVSQMRPTMPHRPMRVGNDGDSSLPLVVGTTLLTLIASKRLLFSSSQLAGSVGWAEVAAGITAASGYPGLRKLVSSPTLLGAANLLVLGVRESLLGLGVFSLLGYQSHKNHRLLQANRNYLNQYRDSDQTELAAVDDAMRHAMPPSSEQPLLTWTLLLSLPTLATQGISQLLGLLVVGCPCIYTLARALPSGAGVAEGAKHGLIVKDEDIFHKMRSADIMAVGAPTQGDHGFNNKMPTIQGQPMDRLNQVKNLQAQGYKVAYLATSGQDKLAALQAETSIYFGEEACGFADVWIQDKRQLAVLMRLTDKVVSKHSLNRKLVLALQIPAMVLTAAGVINPFSALAFHHGLSIMLVLTSQSWPPTRRRAQIRDRKQHGLSTQKRFRPVDTFDTLGFDLLNTNPETGLTSKEAKQRLSQFGANKLPDAKKLSLLQRVAEQCQGTLALVMLGSTGLSLIAGGIWDTVALAGMFLVNAVVGALQSNKADNAVAELQQYSGRLVRVLRDGLEMEIPSENLVPGDVVFLRADDYIPADGRLLSGGELVVDESLLTGESQGVHKVAHLDAKINLTAGTTVVSGEGKLLVLRTSTQTRMGQIALMLQNDPEKATPLQLDLNRLATSLAKGLVVVCIAMVGIGVLNGQPVSQLMLSSAGLAAASIPQGLTTFVTLGLVAGVRELAKRKTVVRRLSSLEAMACVTCLCLDKTGTITQNQMTVRLVSTPNHDFSITGDSRSAKGGILIGEERVRLKDHNDLQALVIAGSLCNNATLTGKEDDLAIHGDSTEGALLVLARKAGYGLEKVQRRFPLLKQAPFSSERERMSTLVKTSSGYRLIVKGSPESILGICNLSATDRRAIQEKAYTWAQQGLRVLALASKDFGEPPSSLLSSEHDLDYLGLVGMLDPPRKEVEDVIARCKEAGIHVVMLTGDHPETAVSISKQVGISANPQTLTGKQLSELQGEQLINEVRHTDVFSRVVPEQKKAVIEALKTAGYVVAMVGDGINDGPALKTADVGISLGGKGANVAQEASDMVLATDDLSQVITAIEQGRTAYDNVGKVVSYLLTSNAGEVSLMLSGAASGMGMPLLPIQLLWVNLLGDGPPALALCVEPADARHITKEPRHQDGTLLTESLKRRILLRGARMGLVTLGLFAVSRLQGVPIATARTRTMAALGVEQILHLFETRIIKPGLPVPDNPTARKTAWLSGAMLLSSMYFPPLRTIFGLVPLELVEWLLVLGFALIAVPPPSTSFVPRLGQPKNT